MIISDLINDDELKVGRKGPGWLASPMCPSPRLPYAVSLLVSAGVEGEGAPSCGLEAASVDDTAASVANANVKPGAGTRSEDDVLTWTGVLTGTLETLEAGSCVTGTVPLLAPLPVEELLPDSEPEL